MVGGVGVEGLGGLDLGKLVSGGWGREDWG